MLGIGSDHWGVDLKSDLLHYLISGGIPATNFGTDSAEPVDYPDIARRVAEAITSRSIDRGILICRTGLGMAITANKVPGIYAATVHNLETARSAAASNNAHIITLGSEGMRYEKARAIVAAWLRTPFKGGQSALKLEKIRLLERKYSNVYRVPKAV